MSDVSAAGAVTPAAQSTGRSVAERVWSLARANAFLILLLGATFFFRVFWAAVIPAFQNPDEPQHLAYVQNLGEKVTLSPSEWIPREIGFVEELTGLVGVPFHPAETQMFAARSLDGPKEEELDRVPDSLRTTDDIGRADSAANYPPTYYFIASLVYRALAGFDLLTIVFGIRALSALMSTGTMLFNYLTLRRFFGDDRTAKSSALIIGMSPMYANSGAAINPDVLVWLVFSVFLYLLTRAFDEGLSQGMNVGIGATMVVGTLVKQTFLIAVPMYGILLCFLLFRKLLSPKQAAYSLVTVLIMLAVLDGWLYASGVIRTSPSYPGEHEQQARTITGFVRHLSDRWQGYSGTYDTFWGNFGWLDTPMSGRIFALIRTGSAIAIVGLVFYLVSSIAERRPDLKAMFFVLISVVFVSGWVVVNYLRITSGEGWLLQGRYFFPIIVPIIALLLRGLLWFVPYARARDGLLVALVVGVLWLQTDALAGYIVPRFYA